MRASEAAFFFRAPEVPNEKGGARPCTGGEGEVASSHQQAAPWLPPRRPVASRTAWPYVCPCNRAAGRAKARAWLKVLARVASSPNGTRLKVFCRKMVMRSCVPTRMYSGETPAMKVRQNSLSPGIGVWCGVRVRKV